MVKFKMDLTKAIQEALIPYGLSIERVTNIVYDGYGTSISNHHVNGVEIEDCFGFALQKVGFVKIHWLH